MPVCVCARAHICVCAYVCVFRTVLELSILLTTPGQSTRERNKALMLYFLYLSFPLCNLFVV